MLLFSWIEWFTHSSSKRIDSRFDVPRLAHTFAARNGEIRRGSHAARPHATLVINAITVNVSGSVPAMVRSIGIAALLGRRFSGAGCFFGVTAHAPNTFTRKAIAQMRLAKLFFANFRTHAFSSVLSGTS